MSITRRKALATVFGTVATAGCTALGFGGGSSDETPTETTPPPTTTEQSFTVSGRLIRENGDPVTRGQVLVLIRNGGVATLNPDGSFSTAVTGRPPAEVVYSQVGAGPRTTASATS